MLLKACTKTRPADHFKPVEKLLPSIILRRIRLTNPDWCSVFNLMYQDTIVYILLQ
jgi:hypothetical protein